MALTLTAGISATDYLLAITGTVPDVITSGYEFRLGDELVEIGGFVRLPPANPAHPWDRELDRNQWLVQRGRSRSVAVAHDAGTAIRAAVDAFVSGEDESPTPSPFAGGGSVTPAAFVEPTTATPEAIADALIAAGLMDGPP